MNSRLCMCVSISVIFSSPVYCMKVITDNLIATGDDNGCVKVNNFDTCTCKIKKKKNILIIVKRFN